MLYLEQRAIWIKSRHNSIRKYIFVQQLGIWYLFSIKLAHVLNKMQVVECPWKWDIYTHEAIETKQQHLIALLHLYSTVKEISVHTFLYVWFSFGFTLLLLDSLIDIRIITETKTLTVLVSRLVTRIAVFKTLAKRIHKQKIVNGFLNETLLKHNQDI